MYSSNFFATCGPSSFNKGRRMVFRFTKPKYLQRPSFGTQQSGPEFRKPTCQKVTGCGVNFMILLWFHRKGSRNARKVKMLFTVIICDYSELLNQNLTKKNKKLNISYTCSPAQAWNRATEHPPDLWTEKFWWVQSTGVAHGQESRSSAFCDLQNPEKWLSGQIMIFHQPIGSKFEKRSWISLKITGDFPRN